MRSFKATNNQKCEMVDYFVAGFFLYFNFSHYYGNLLLWHNGRFTLPHNVSLQVEIVEFFSRSFFVVDIVVVVVVSLHFSCVYVTFCCAVHHIYTLYNASCTPVYMLCAVHSVKFKKNIAIKVEPYLCGKRK